MLTLLSLVTSVKDYIEVVHKLVETNVPDSIGLTSYYDFGAILTYLVFAGKEFFSTILTFKWLQTIWSLPLIIPDLASAMVSEVSVLDGYFHNAFTFLETPVSYGNQNFLFYGIEKFSIGLINSIFLCLPTSTAHIITLRRFVMQGIEAGYLAGLGTLAGNILWIGSILFGLRFIVIPWLSLDILRYGLGFLLLVKYMWDSYSERRTVLEDLSKWKIFLLNFLLAFTEQATIYPFLSNLSIGSDATLLESFPTSSFFEYSTVHTFYLAGLLVGSLSLLQFTCWFWENPAFNIYMWAVSSLKLTNTFSQRLVNVCFLYLTMFFAISNVSYFGLDYTLTNPLGFVHEDRLVDQKVLLETSFLNTKASDRNTRRNRGRHGRRERWKRRVRRYRTFDASLYDQGVYDLFTIEDLNYGFDRFWLRRKIRNHRVRFRFFPGPWMRSFKKQLARPRLESFMGPRVEFFRILFEQAYHPEFHEFRETKGPPLLKNEKNQKIIENSDIQKPLLVLKNSTNKNLISFYSENTKKIQTQNLLRENSALRKFVRKVHTRTNTAQILSDIQTTNPSRISSSISFTQMSTKPIYSKRWKQIFSKISHNVNETSISKGPEKKLLNNFYKQIIFNPIQTKQGKINYFQNFPSLQPQNFTNALTFMKKNSETPLSKKDRQILRYKTFLSEKTKELTSFKESQNDKTKSSLTNLQNDIYKPLTLLHPIKFYLQKDQAFQKKMKFYGATIFRNFALENNAPYYRVMMKKFFYYYKPTLRWERTMRTATMRKARRKGPRIPRKLNINKKTQMLASVPLVQDDVQNREKLQSIREEEILKNSTTKIQKPTHFYSLVSKRATRYRYQIYKDVLQHWYYSPFNRLLLKLDVDAFIRRQPTAHFLTKKEENLLHLKRFLLTDYYNTLRWYSYMQHYDSMKTNIGKTKSFSSGSYNQQFFGTFKKIRHLFAITPSLTESNILKFDQPLFNEYHNFEKALNKNFSLYNSSVIHEELLVDDDIYYSRNSSKNFPEDLTNQSTNILKTYLQQATPIRQEYIKKLLQDKNYSELTDFLFKGQKIRGDIPITNENNFLNQEKDYLLKINEKTLEKQKLHEFFEHKILEKTLNKSNEVDFYSSSTDPTYLWISLMKKCRNMLYNQEALKIYVSGRVDKLEKQKKRQDKSFKNRLSNMKRWVSLGDTKYEKDENPTLTNLSGLKTSLQKAIKEGIYYQTSGMFSGKNLEKSNLRNNRQKILQNLPFFTDFTRMQKVKNYNIWKNKLQKATNISINVKNHLRNRTRLRALQTLQTENNLRKTFSSIQKLTQKKTSKLTLESLNPNILTTIVHRTLVPFKFVSQSIFQKIEALMTSQKGTVFINPIQYTFKILTRNKEKNLNTWKKRETVLSTRKKIRRKIYRVLDQKKQIEKTSNIDALERLMKINNSKLLRQKKDGLESFERSRRQKSWNAYKNSKLKNSTEINSTTNLKKTSRLSSRLFSEIFEKQFKRKRTRSRRYRRFKGRGPIKKHTLAEKLKRQFKLLKRYGEKQEGQDKKMEILEMITKRKYNPNSSFRTRETKQRRTRQSKHRYWKKHKRQKYLQTKRKQRKRRRYALSKLRVLNKEFKRIQNNLQIKKWWWQSFLPNFRATTDTYWQIEKNKQIKEELSTLSVKEILERDDFMNSQNQYAEKLQIGNQDFKPLAIPEALRLRKNLVEQGLLNFGTETEKKQNFYSNSSRISKQLNFNNAQWSENQDLSMKSDTNLDTNKSNTTSMNSMFVNEKNLVSKLSENLLKTNNLPNYFSSWDLDSKKIRNINPMPFYAGWDETVRQFIVTNRLLSRKDAGYFMNLSTQKPILDLIPPTLKSLQKSNSNEQIEFTKSPLQGMNAATTLYWQIPFTTYDPDQFFALGMDGFSPLAWRNFNFKHSKQTLKPMLVQNIFSTNENTLKKESLFSYNIHLKLLQMNLKNNSNDWANSLSSKTNKTSKNQSRKIQKRQKRVKKHPRPPVWFPAGPLANQVLPVHYIYVFYKRTRLPRDRYIGRRMRRSDDLKSGFIQSNFTKIIDFTLRKRAQPIRKYHRKRILNKNQENGLVVRRRPFKDFETENVRYRPITKTRLTTQTDILNASLLKIKQRKKNLTNKQSSENIRIRQLRRRIQRQVLRPIWRYKPRAGGFVWPGDYLRFEAVKAPTLKLQKDSLNSKTKSTESNLQVRKKKRRNIQEWQIQPKKYLLEKHNLKVLKRRLEKSQNLNKFSQKIKEFNHSF
uniref:Hypothetical chloroplast protein RF1 n=1 Tax=Kirchneriella aperta TaxID=117505 RepID=A0A140HA21_9CHLO|nr:hypothetical chloroplast protein RF1 [Kirchneriella aperta]AMO01020.1 hypothetical chloroplast protein RF1 [Kirchneriella aperta]